MKNFSIKTKLILIFILIKIIPLMIISYIAYVGVLQLDKHLHKNIDFLFNETKQVISETAYDSIDDSIKFLDKKSQNNLEKISIQIAEQVAQFLYHRDDDVKLLATLPKTHKSFNEFYKIKYKNIIIHDEYTYDDTTHSWKPKQNTKESIIKLNEQAVLKDNQKDFHKISKISLKTKSIPLYKEITYFDLKGQELIKISSIDERLKNISMKKNTYIGAENYFQRLSTLKQGDIFVSNVVGEYVGSKVIGPYTKEKAKKVGIEFEPEQSAYAGKENPVGKKFTGIIRFVTPVYENNQKTGYVSIALDHEHIMQYTDTINPVKNRMKQNIADASVGNYAFMWDNVGRNISHPRDYFIVGFDKKTGNYAQPWLSSEIAQKFAESKLDIDEFLEQYPSFDHQSLKKKPNIKQLVEDGNIGLDCRYLNFAPQCSGWMQLTNDGGHGSFTIFWSKVWKLTTAATIPYYTGDYKNSSRGFGFITVGANVDEFHAAANETKNNVDTILNGHTQKIKSIVDENTIKVEEFVKSLIQELTIVTFLMIIIMISIALWLSSYISKKIENLIVGTTKFSHNDLSYRIKVTSKDEIGRLENSFNDMAEKIDGLLKEEKKSNERLEIRVKEEIAKREEHERIMMQQAKFVSMGEMISNIAHQWRQPLNALSLLIQNINFLYKNDQLNDEFMDKTISKAKKLTTNMSSTIDDFRTFFKPNKTKEIFDLHNSIEMSLSLLEVAFENNQIKIERKFTNQKIEVDGYPNEFAQSLVNILGNAKDALLEAKGENPMILIQTAIDGNKAILEIIDNGTGIKEDIIDDIFNLYFTTKGEVMGTGIGLYMSKTIIENNMNGSITVNNIEKGVQFTIKLPLYKSVDEKN